MIKSYQDVLGDILSKRANRIILIDEDPCWEQVDFLDTCIWGIIFGAEMHDEILCVVKEVLDEDRLGMEGGKVDPHRKQNMDN